MRYRKLDANGDYTISTGQDFHINNPDAVAQAVLTRLRLWLGEWFVDTSDGTPWETEVLGKNFAGRNYDGVIRQRILGTEGVTEILEYTSTYNGDTRRVAINATLNTIYGQATLSEIL